MNPDPAVLCVEDDPKSRKVMSLLLSTRMKLSRVTFFEESENFLARVQTLDPVPEVVFLDIHVKPYSGFEMLAMLRQLPRFEAVPIVALTASVMNEEVQELRAAGFDGCLAKPLDMMTFPDTLQRILNGERVWKIVV